MLLSTVLSNRISRSTAIVVLGMVGHVLSVAATSPEPDIVGQPLGEVFNVPSQVLSSQTRLIFYRPQGPIGMKGVARVYVNGSYHTALMPTSYSVLCLAPGPVKVDVRQIRRHSAANDLNDAQAQIQLEGAKTVYLSIQMPEGARYGLQTIDAAIAVEELKTTREQIHTLTRVADAQECKDPLADAAKPAVAPASNAQKLKTPAAPPANQPQ